MRGTSNLSTSYDGKHAHSFTPAGSISVTTNPSFSGTAGTTGSTTQGGTVTSSFYGEPSATGTIGKTTPFSILPPYVVKYCWERTA